MDARTALKNYAGQMVRLYGPDFMEHMSADDRLTFETLASNVNKEREARKRDTRDNTNIIQRIKGHRPVGVLDPKERARQWQALADKHGTGIIGKLSPERKYDGPVKDYAPDCDTPAPSAWTTEAEWEDTNSSNIFGRLMAQFSHK